MIYPPEYKNSILNSEEKVFKDLSELPDDDFTTFYSQWKDDTTKRKNYRKWTALN